MSGDKNPAWRGGREPYYGGNWDRQQRQRGSEISIHANAVASQKIRWGKLQRPPYYTSCRFSKRFLRANALWNLISLCSSCHKYLEWHKTEMTAFLKTWQPQLDSLKQCKLSRNSGNYCFQLGPLGMDRRRHRVSCPPCNTLSTNFDVARILFDPKHHFKASANATNNFSRCA